jgi:hypothetical protein
MILLRYIISYKYIYIYLIKLLIEYYRIKYPYLFFNSNETNYIVAV